MWVRIHRIYKGKCYWEQLIIVVRRGKHRKSIGRFGGELLREGGQLYIGCILASRE